MVSSSDAKKEYLASIFSCVFYHSSWFKSDSRYENPNLKVHYFVELRKYLRRKFGLKYMRKKKSFYIDVPNACVVVKLVKTMVGFKP
jgi:hypothetical protein